MCGRLCYLTGHLDPLNFLDAKAFTSYYVFVSLGQIEVLLATFAFSAQTELRPVVPTAVLPWREAGGLGQPGKGGC